MTRWADSTTLGSATSWPVCHQLTPVHQGWSPCSVVVAAVDASSPPVSLPSVVGFGVEASDSQLLRRPVYPAGAVAARVEVRFGVW